MAVITSLEEIVSKLDDNTTYTLFLTGKGDYEGCFRIDKALGSEIKHNHLAFEAFEIAEIYQNEFYAGNKENRIDESVIVNKIEHSIKERYYRRRELKGRGLKSDLHFVVSRITGSGRYLREETSGRQLSQDLKGLMINSRTLTIVEKKSNADNLLQEITDNQGRIKIHEGDKLFSELSAEEKAKYKIGDDYKIDPFESANNVIEHHKD
ncbi:hypothetical protein ES705_20351 [subsurface metagenome]